METKKFVLKGINFINATPHEIIFIEDFGGDNDNGDNVYCIEPSGYVARVEQKEYKVPPLFTIIKNGEVTGLPPVEDNTIVIVSAFVKSVSNRHDLVSPNTGATAERNDKGHITAVRSFIL
ncbi:MAG: hypothetical protein ACRCZ9_08335, partial [Fusobacteriaceae bacterium]